MLIKSFLNLRFALVLLSIETFKIPFSTIVFTNCILSASAKTSTFLSLPWVKSTIKPESQVQITNLVEILKAFPNVSLKIGGYTDNVGDAKSNLKLSADRAAAVVAALKAAGIDGKRLESEGYGQEHPVASNDTEEGRTQNRRIAARVTAK